MQSTYGETGQTYFKSVYFDKSKIGNTVIDFDIQCISKALETEGRLGVSSEKIAHRVWEHYVDSARLVKRAFGAKIKDDFNLYNWGLALTQQFGLEQDRIELLILVYGKTVPNRLKLSEFELIILKHTSYKALEKQERKHKWVDLIESFRIQSIKLRPGDECWTIGRRQLRMILDVNDLTIVFDVTVFTSDLKRSDRYSNKIHMLLLDDPLVSGKRLSTLGGNGPASLEALTRVENKRLEQFKRRITAEEDDAADGEDSIDGMSGDGTGGGTGGDSQTAKNEAVSINMKRAFMAKSFEKESKAAERAIKMAEKAAARAVFLKEDEERRQRVNAYLAKLKEKQRGGIAAVQSAGGPDGPTEDELREVDNFDGDDRDAMAAGASSPRHDAEHVDNVSAAADSAPVVPPPPNLTPEEQLRSQLAEKLAAHQLRRAEEKALEKRRLREMVQARLDARKQRLAEAAATAPEARREQEQADADLARLLALKGAQWQQGAYKVHDDRPASLQRTSSKAASCKPSSDAD